MGVITMHFEILDDKRIDLLEKITNTIDYIPYSLGGGTGLSLQLGLRKSYDFDFFVKDNFTPDAVYSSLQNIATENIKAINVDNKGTCDAIVDGIQVSFFYYPYKTINPVVKTEKIPNLQILSIPDIAAMKCVAIGNRGTKKDFFDLYEVLQKENIEPRQLASWILEKYGYDRNYAYITMGLNYFEDAEREKLPETFVPYNWDNIKDFFSSYQNKLIYALDHIQNDLQL